jgi:hypothetical protein
MLPTTQASWWLKNENLKNRKGAKDARMIVKSEEQISSQNPNRWLIIACAVLIVIDLLWIPLGVASIPRFIQRVTTLTIPVYGVGIGNVLTNESVAAQANARGMSLPAFAWYLLAVQLFAALIFTAVGGLVLWRGRAHWFGWFTAHVMLFLNSYAFYLPLQVAQLLPPAFIDLGSVFWPTVLIYFFLFPNGRVVPRWMIWPMFVYGVSHFLFQLSGVLINAGWLPEGIFQILLGPVQTYILGIFVVVIACQVYRFARVSSRAERAQTKWMIFGLAILVFLPSIADLLGAGRIFQTFEWGTLSLTIAPITLAIAILRYRLWDIDIIIRRTLQYGLLSGVLALIYFGSVVLGQRLAGTLTGSPDAPLVLVVSTLLIAALFSPLRARIQEFIDRRFYRRKYDAIQTLATFTQTARDETHLERLVPALLGAVQDSVQPEQAWLWLKKPGRSYLL